MESKSCPPSPPASAWFLGSVHRDMPPRPNPAKKNDRCCEARQQQEAREQPRKLAHPRPPLLQCKNHHFQKSVLVCGHDACSDGRCCLVLQYPTPQRVRSS